MKLGLDIKILFDGEQPEETYTLAALGKSPDETQLFVLVRKPEFAEMERLDSLKLTPEEATALLDERFPGFTPIIIPAALVYDNTLAEIPEENLLIVDLRKVSHLPYMPKI